MRRSTGRCARRAIACVFSYLPRRGRCPKGGGTSKTNARVRSTSPSVAYRRATFRLQDQCARSWRWWPAAGAAQGVDRRHRHARRHRRRAGPAGAVRGSTTVDAAVQELPSRRRNLGRPRQLHPLRLDAGAASVAVEQPEDLGDLHRDRRAAGLRLRLCADPRDAAAQAAVPGGGPGADPGALAAAGDVDDLSLRQPGHSEGAARRQRDLRRRRHRRLAGLLLLPARADDPGHGAADGRPAALRGGRGAGRLALAHLLDRYPAGRALRPDQRDLRLLHPGADRFRHRQGDRRAVQRARHRRLQAGHRRAELRDGRRGRPDPAGAGRAVVLRRPLCPEAAGGAALGARGALRAQTPARPRCAAVRVLRRGRRPDPDDHRRRRLGLADQALALQPVADARQLRLREFRSHRLGSAVDLAEDGRLGRRGRRRRRLHRRLAAERAAVAA